MLHVAQKGHPQRWRAEPWRRGAGSWAPPGVALRPRRWKQVGSLAAAWRAALAWTLDPVLQSPRLAFPCQHAGVPSRKGQ